MSEGVTAASSKPKIKLIFPTCDAGSFDGSSFSWKSRKGLLLTLLIMATNVTRSVTGIKSNLAACRCMGCVTPHIYTGRRIRPALRETPGRLYSRHNSTQ